MEGQICTNEILIGSEYPKKLVGAIDNSQRCVFILMFDWRFYPYEPASDVQKVNMALARAVQRGVKVQCLANSLQIVEKLKEIGLDCRKFNSADLLHSKLVVIDDEVFFIGSHNFSKNAFNYNYETSVMSLDPVNAKLLSTYFQRLWQL